MSIGILLVFDKVQVPVQNGIPTQQYEMLVWHLPQKILHNTNKPLRLRRKNHMPSIKQFNPRPRNSPLYRIRRRNHPC